jgi:hypothetical protein
MATERNIGIVIGCLFVMGDIALIYAVQYGSFGFKGLFSRLSRFYKTLVRSPLSPFVL